MKRFTFCLTVVLLFMAGNALAETLRKIELDDGSVISGEIVSANGGIYTIRSNSLGTIKIEESKIRLIRMKPSSESAASSQGYSTSAAQVKAIQEKMLSDQEIMALIPTLQNDPEFKKILADPEIMKAVNAGDIDALTANPKFMNLLNNPTVQKIEQKVK